MNDNKEKVNSPEVTRLPSQFNDTCMTLSNTMQLSPMKDKEEMQESTERVIRVQDYLNYTCMTQSKTMQMNFVMDNEAKKTFMKVYLDTKFHVPCMLKDNCHFQENSGKIWIKGQ